MKLPAPWWCCFEWHPRSVICLLDILSHDAERLMPKRLRSRWRVFCDPICDRHDRMILASCGEPPVNAGQATITYRLPNTWTNGA